MVEALKLQYEHEKTIMTTDLLGRVRSDPAHGPATECVYNMNYALMFDTDGPLCDDSTAASSLQDPTPSLSVSSVTRTAVSEAEVKALLGQQEQYYKRILDRQEEKYNYVLGKLYHHQHQHQYPHQDHHQCYTPRHRNPLSSRRRNSEQDSGEHRLPEGGCGGEYSNPRPTTGIASESDSESQSGSNVNNVQGEDILLFQYDDTPPSPTLDISDLTSLDTHSDNIADGSSPKMFKPFQCPPGFDQTSSPHSNPKYTPTKMKKRPLSVASNTSGVNGTDATTKNNSLESSVSSDHSTTTTTAHHNSNNNSNIDCNIDGVPVVVVVKPMINTKIKKARV